MRWAAALVLLASLACDREARPLRGRESSATVVQAFPASSLHAGRIPEPSRTEPRRGEPRPPGDFLDSAWAVAEGKRLFVAFNCVGCHSMGGGGMGPPLMDGHWIYGSAPGRVFATIVEGRPNGMPSFRNKIAETELWKLVAFVRSMSGLTPGDSVSARDDDMLAVPPPPISADRPPAPPEVDAP